MENEFLRFMIQKRIPYAVIKFTLISSLFGVQLIYQNSIAATITWNHSKSSDWSDSSNWVGGVVPGISDKVIINQNEQQAPMINNGSFSINSLALGETIGTSSDSGSLVIQEGAKLNTDYTYIGSSQGLSGSVTVTGSGSTLNASQSMYLGYNGSGSLTIEDGGAVNLLNSSLYMGAFNRGETDNLVVSGEGSNLNITGSGWLLLAYGNNATSHDSTSIVTIEKGAKVNADGVDVGYGGYGILTISDGGMLSTQHGLVAPYEGARGDILITGKNSQWVIGDELTVAHSGVGNVVVSNGGLLENKGYASIASGSASNATVRVTGTDSRWLSGLLYLGYGGDGNLIVDNGGYVSSADGYIGVAATSTSAAVVTGKHSAWESSGELAVGYQGNGSLTIAELGTVSAVDITLAYDAGSKGVLNIGAAAGYAPVLPGSLNTQNITFGNGEGTIVFNHTDNSGYYVFSPKIQGQNGSLEILAGTTTLTGSNDFAGNAHIAQSATLMAGAKNTLSANANYTIDQGGLLLLKGYDQTIKSLSNAGFVDLTGASPGTILTIAGDYKGENGSLIFGSQLAGDSSPTDQLVIEGNATGSTYVAVKNLGGTGAQTVEGIKIIDVQGISDNNAFIQRGRIVAGAYEYSLKKGSATNQDQQSWYLTSPGHDNTPVLRPEGIGYLTNLTLANTLFNLRLHDRQGEREYIDPITGKKKSTSLWLRHSYTRNNFNDASGQLSSRTNRNVFQLGGDILQTSFSGKDRFHLGVMAGYGYVEGHSKSKITGYKADTDLKGYNTGLYSTWYENSEDMSGLYIDSWLMWSHFTAKVKGKGLAQEKYNLQGVSGSLELGYTFELAQLNKDYSLWLQPQAQAIWEGVKADNHTESNGTRITNNHGNVQTRVGGRLILIPETSAKWFVSPYLETNWIHNSKDYAVSMNKVRTKQESTKNIGEVKVGISGNISPNTQLWMSVGQQFSKDAYRDTTTNLGIKYRF